MALTLDQNETINTTITAYEVNSFAVDLDRMEIVVGYDKIDSEGVSRGESVLIIDGANFAGTITDASTIAGADVYTALKQALYNAITSQTGMTGTVV